MEIGSVHTPDTATRALRKPDPAAADLASPEDRARSKLKAMFTSQSSEVRSLTSATTPAAASNRSESTGRKAPADHLLGALTRSVKQLAAAEDGGVVEAGDETSVGSPEAIESSDDIDENAADPSADEGDGRGLRLDARRKAREERLAAPAGGKRPSRTDREATRDSEASPRNRWADMAAGEALAGTSKLRPIDAVTPVEWHGGDRATDSERVIFSLLCRGLLALVVVVAASTLGLWMVGFVGQ